MGAEEKSLRLYDTRKTFIGKLGNTLSRIITPTQAGINSILINIKRSTMIKNYKNISKCSNEKKENAEKKFQESYTLYLEAIDQLIVDTIYKKVRNDKASDFEKEALAKYYNVIHFKENDEYEYKLKKQEYLLDLDFSALKNSKKQKVFVEFQILYVHEVEKLYKALLKHYSMKLTEKLTPMQKEEIYNKIFDTLENYVLNIVPMKSVDDVNIKNECALIEPYEVGKLDQVDVLDKRMILLGISRKLFVHSLPLVVCERCYIKLLKDTRSLIVDTKVTRKRENAYKLLLNLIEQYNEKLLDVKIYWDKNETKKEYTIFSEKRKQLIETKDKITHEEFERKRQILYIREDLKMLDKFGNKYYRIIQFYKKRLVFLGDMKELKNSRRTLRKRLKGQVQKNIIKQKEIA